MEKSNTFFCISALCYAAASCTVKNCPTPKARRPHHPTGIRDRVPVEARIPILPFAEGESRGLERESGLLKVTELGQSWDRSRARVLSPGVMLQRDRDKQASHSRTWAGPGGGLLGVRICDSGVELTCAWAQCCRLIWHYCCPCREWVCLLCSDFLPPSRKHANTPYV